MPAALAGAVHRGDDVGLGADGDLAEDGSGQRRRDGQRVAALGGHGDAGGQAVGLVAAGTQGRSGGGVRALGRGHGATVSPPGVTRTGSSRPWSGSSRAWSGARRYRGEMAGLRTVDVGRLRGRAVTRDPDEPYRASTPLELFFDLTFVVAVARASAALHHELVAGHVAEGVWGFIGVFFAVWWAWMNATWFASAHDADDVPYRLLMLVQMAGVLVLATGVTDALEHDDWLVVTIGYAVMRVGLAVSWLRVARDEPAGRTRALRYAAGISVLQVLWFARLALPHGAVGIAGFLVLVAAELAVPVWAERAAGVPVFHAGAHRGAVRALHDHRARRIGPVGLGGLPGRARRGRPDGRAVRHRRGWARAGVRQLVAVLRPPRPPAPPPRARRSAGATHTW